MNVDYFYRSDSGRYFARIVNPDDSRFGNEYRFEPGQGWVPATSRPVLRWEFEMSVNLESVDSDAPPAPLML